MTFQTADVLKKKEKNPNQNHIQKWHRKGKDRNWVVLTEVKGWKQITCHIKKRVWVAFACYVNVAEVNAAGPKQHHLYFYKLDTHKCNPWPYQSSTEHKFIINNHSHSELYTIFINNVVNSIVFIIKTKNDFLQGISSKREELLVSGQMVSRR